jgi:hypothetical protein
MRSSRICFGAGLALALAGSASALEPATSDAIRATFAGNTVQGDMAASGSYTEYYAADGTIRAKDYQGAWRIDGDRMCFRYGADPESCWQVGLAGDRVTWLADGKIDGTGTVVPGNPNGF